LTYAWGREAGEVACPRHTVAENGGSQRRRGGSNGSESFPLVQRWSGTCAWVRKGDETHSPWRPCWQKNRALVHGGLSATGTAGDNVDKWHTAHFIVIRVGLQMGRSGSVNGLSVEHGGDRPMARALGRQGALEWARQGGAGWEVVPVRDRLVRVRFFQAVLARGCGGSQRMGARERPAWPQKLRLDSGRGRRPMGERGWW
jgi:hypothetical protein